MRGNIVEVKTDTQYIIIAVEQRGGFNEKTIEKAKKAVSYYKAKKEKLIGKQLTGSNDKEIKVSESTVVEYIRAWEKRLPLLTIDIGNDYVLYVFSLEIYTK